jgi:methionyl-tRNA synthetase
MARILITSALPYINGVKHLGNLAGSQLPADVYARFQRARGAEVLLICATDEHGTPAELAAAAAGQDVRTYCDEQHALQRTVGEGFGLSWDWFGRSSSPENRRLTQEFADVLEDHGLIEERTDKMIYSVEDGRFLPDRYVEGTCPICGHRPARGDQCDNCGSLLDPLDLIDPYSAVSGSTRLEIRETRHLYLLQTKLADEIRAFVEARPDFPPLTRSIALKHLDEGLIDRGITRDLSWGVPVTRHGAPRPGFETKVFYVWFDAPIEYIAATKEWAAATGGDWERWWREPEAADVRYVEFMGKDNVAFHTVSFPATLIGANNTRGEDGVWRPTNERPWKLVDQLKSLNWLNWYGGKFSTSQRRGVFMDAALEILPADVWRWYLTANAPENADSAFTWEQFQTLVNKDLADVLGNFVNRILKFAETRFDGETPAGGAPGPLEERLHVDLSVKLAELTQRLEEIEIRKSAQALRAIWVLGNEYLTEAAPWTALKTDPPRAAAAVRTGINLVALFARLMGPFLPFTAKIVAGAVGETATHPWPTADAAVELGRIPPGRKVAAPAVLFRKIEDADVALWKERFGGGE